MNRIRRIAGARVGTALNLAAALALLGASGCGQKGQLYLPDAAPAVVPATVAPPSKPADPPDANPDDKKDSSPASGKSAESPQPG